MRKKQIIYIIYIRRSGYKVIKTDGINKFGIEELKKELKNNTSAFAGQSGVRKIYSYKSYSRRKTNRGWRNK